MTPDEVADEYLRLFDLAVEGKLHLGIVSGVLRDMIGDDDEFRKAVSKAVHKKRPAKAKES